MQALSRFGDLAWFKLPTEYNAVYGYRQVPYMGWRFVVSNVNVALLIQAVVEKLSTQVEWTFDRTSRNWLLFPSRILQEAQGLDNPAFANAVSSISAHDEEFCRKAFSDLELIIASLQEATVP
ncbi:hypothetical protein PV343_30305 [Streptomyces sp. WI03-4A]|uniref:hypothetical protein n=1 Tax=Streptomyces TaxID=1883 RepID=UPI0029A43FD3|nr:hypothetical protein [Streptomyces sp. WI03-4A]MDX2596514.1 hypothetical protein [Streptomyces sp. WI03-4A]